MNRYLSHNLKRAGGLQAGYKTQQVIPRPPRSYVGEREVQIMRHISTMLFFYLKHKYGLLTKEVQCMLVFHPTNNPHTVNMDDYSLLIGENARYNTSVLNQVLNNTYLLEEALSRTYGTGDDLTLSKRFKKHFHGYKSHRDEYLELARNDSDLDSRKRALLIYDLLMTRNAYPIDVSDYKEKNPLVRRGLYTVYQTRRMNNEAADNRHIEEKFIDILEHYHPTWRSVIIAGKKRPCGSCYGRIHGFVHNYQQNLRKIKRGKVQPAENHIDGYVVYNQHPGKLWKGRWEGQPLSVKRYTMRCFGSNNNQKHTHLSRQQDICTESCSDPWEDND